MVEHRGQSEVPLTQKLDIILSALLPNDQIYSIEGWRLFNWRSRKKSLALCAVKDPEDRVVVTIRKFNREITTEDIEAMERAVAEIPVEVDETDPALHQTAVEETGRPFIDIIPNDPNADVLLETSALTSAGLQRALGFALIPSRYMQYCKGEGPLRIIGDNVDDLRLVQELPIRSD